MDLFGDEDAGYADMGDDLFGDDNMDESVNVYNQFDNADMLSPIAFDSTVEHAQSPSQQRYHEVHLDHDQMRMLKAQNNSNNDLAAFVGEEAVGGDPDFDLNNLNERPLSIGEKSDNAVDYEDISDGDLPDEESTMNMPVPDGLRLQGIEEAAAQDSDVADHSIDDLFDGGDEMDTSFNNQNMLEHSLHHRSGDDSDLASDSGQGTMALLDQRDDQMTEEEQREWRLQQMLLARMDEAEAGTEPSNIDLWLQQEFPTFDRDDPSPFWNRLLPPKPGKWQGKEPKRPRPLRPTKVTLDIESDQKTFFTVPAGIATAFEPRHDLVYVPTRKDEVEAESGDDDSESDEALPLGLTTPDLDTICADFDTLSHVAIDDVRIVGEDEDMLTYEAGRDDFSDFEHPSKKRKTGLDPRDLVAVHQLEFSSFDNPEKLTARLAREVILDLNDSALLLEETGQQAQQRIKNDGQKAQAATVRERLAMRFKTSNDASYALLQGNKKKVRGQLTNMTIDHSGPAVKLQYPYYKVKLTLQEMRNYHRSRMNFKHNISFSKVHRSKRQEMKKKAARDAFSKTRELSIADNAHTLLLEYSEEYPTMLSGFGMGNKIVNYYRKLDANDNNRPKPEVGETQVLMPEDKSPFGHFGHVDPGQQVLSLYNSMYRAPLFHQPPKQVDFLLVRETTGLHGQQYYLRNADYQYVVGQEFPSVAVPNARSRMVTTASKNRLRAISYRLARKKKSHRIRVEEVTRHFPDTNDMQNRQKMKEFMQFNKDHKEWEMKNNEILPDEEDIQKLTRPEDICLLEAMQVGVRYLDDAGYADNDDDDDDDGVKKGRDEYADMPIEQKLAPWRTTKNFIAASQGKAMLQLNNAGDPSGRGEAMSFLKTSMKGGFQAQGGSTEDNIKNRSRDKSGHTYNVAAQQQQYDDTIRRIWEKQRAALSSSIDPTLDDEGVDAQLDDNRHDRSISVSGHPGSTRRRDDETGTSFSRQSRNSNVQQKYLVITRKVWSRKDEEYQEQQVIETDPAVIKQYLRQKELEEANISIDDIVPTGDPEVDARHRKR